jgi:5-methylcytosine-specific restriction endonuclease McrA
MFKNLDELLDFFPTLDMDKKIYSFEEEMHDFLFKKLISTYIPNKLPSSHPLELQKYFVDKVYSRTGKKLEKRNQFISKLIVYSMAYHNTNRKTSMLDPEIYCNLCKMSFVDGHLGLDPGTMDILNPGTYFSNLTKQEDPKIDHISPLSKFGNNDVENFQTLCFVCNSGKSDISSQYDKYNLFNERVRIERFEEFRELEIHGFESKKSAFYFLPYSLFFRVINRDGKCVYCDQSENRSLTMKPIDKDSLYTYDNLVTICYSCLKTDDNIKEIRFIKN